MEEEREQALKRSAIYQQDLRRYHSRRVKTRSFQEGDLVLRLVQSQVGMHKLSPPWEGPFIISRKLHNGSYYLVDAREHSTTTNNTDHSTNTLEERNRPWNVAQLRPTLHKVPDLVSPNVTHDVKRQQVLDALFSLPGYLRGLEGF